jgi:uncharacterized membrane protein
MTVVACREDLLGSALQAERLWHDVERWGSFVDGFAQVRQIRGDWPAAGGVVEWSSTPHGRGAVTERMLEHRPAELARSEVTDDRLSGTRTVTFSALPDVPNGLQVSVALDYRLTGPLWRHLAIDWLFVRRALRDSMQRELERFATELEEL